MENGIKSEEPQYIHIPFNLTQTGGINLNLITPKHKEFSTEVICSICLAMVYDPTMCKKCESIFCRGCIGESLKRSLKCPNKCLFEEREIPGVLRNLLNKFELQCYYTKNGCLAILLYSDFPQHCDDCEYGDFKCNTANCNYIGIKIDTIAHIEICPLKLLLCKYCTKEVYRKDYDTHVKECGMKMVRCIYCNEEYLSMVLDTHMKDNCNFIQIQCENCLVDYIKQDYANHNVSDCLNNQVEYWKNKANESLKEMDALKEKVKNENNKTQKYINYSIKVLENSQDVIHARCIKNTNTNIEIQSKKEEDNNGDDDELLFSSNHNGSSSFK